MTVTKENAPAMAYSLFATFPTGKVNYKNGMPEMQAIIQTGMELRDYFAAQAVAVAGANMHSTYDSLPIDKQSQAQLYKDVAEAAYQMADAMLAARSLTSDKG